MVRLSVRRRIALAIGGFLIFLGLIIIGFFILAYLNVIDVNTLLNPEYRLLFILILLVLGVLDLVSAVILAR
jgi:hypothetical protein